jgi:multidrug resistance protein, MATE family
MLIAPDYLQCIYGAILRSAGLERSAMLIFFSGFYLVGLPSMLFLVYVMELELVGVWIGLTVAASAAVIMFYITTTKMNWDECIKSVRYRVANEKSSKPIESQ